MLLHLKKISLFTLIILFVLKGLLEYNYFSFVHPYFEYSGFYLETSIVKMVESYILAFLVFIMLIKYIEINNSPSKIIIYILTIFLFIPLTSLFWLQNHSRIYMYTITFSLILIILLVTLTPKIKSARLAQGKLLFFILVIISTISVYSLVIFQGGLGRINFNLLEVYGVREEFVSNNSKILGYMLPWQAHVINMIVIAVSLHKKRYLTTIIFLFLQLLLFSMTNFKSFLFSPFILLFFNLFSRTILKNYLLFIISLGSTLLTLLVMTITKVSDSILWSSMFIRRLYFVPSDLHNIYFNFFEKKEKYGLSHSILEPFINNPYELNPVRLIAKEYYGREFGPNVGFFGDAYLNFGLFGIILFSIILALLLKVIDSVSTSVPTFLSISILTIPAMSLVNSAFFTSLLTHGILIAIMMLWLTNNFFQKETDYV